MLIMRAGQWAREHRDFFKRRDAAIVLLRALLKAVHARVSFRDVLLAALGSDARAPAQGKMLQAWIARAQCVAASCEEFAYDLPTVVHGHFLRVPPNTQGLNA